MKLIELDLRMRTATGKRFVLILVGGTIVIEPFDLGQGVEVYELKEAQVTNVMRAIAEVTKPEWPTPIKFI